LKSKFPIVGHHFFDDRGTGSIVGGIWDIGEMKCFSPFDAGTAATAVKFESLVAGPSALEGNVQFRP
jgi:hypothetical protein